ncbi:hypothetical protein [Kangiella koreensis]|uniref:Uncharacterized protein n=1 Tax=Kangiella koreensis (strain DSM 16069 / JCM 12317 / KCTC 12182 / SW-125) TaxID=523791 RepID=C7R9J2_KANKD|nr:hypothetical protein [Kangiella koreensis]ACV26083.1 hypothetical protein Kkor_0663 [Kangiella koreensis DSM 16069]
MSQINTPGSPEHRLVQHQFASKYGPLGKTIFTIIGFFSLIFFPYMIYLMLTGQTVDEFLPHEAILFSIILSTVMFWSVISTLKAAFYQYTVTIDKQFDLVIHERAFLLWAKSNVYHFRDIQYVVTSDRKYVNKFVAINVTYGGRHNKTPIYYLYLKPHGGKPILFQESKVWEKLKKRGQELAELVGCRTYTSPPGSFLRGYW